MIPTLPSGRLIVLRALSAFAISLFLPGLAVIDHGSQATGYIASLDLFLMGWLGLIFLQVAWYANVVFYVICYQIPRERRVSLVLIAAAMLLPLSTFVPATVPYGEAFVGSATLSGMGAGPILWLATIYSMAIVGLIRRKTG